MGPPGGFQVGDKVGQYCYPHIADIRLRLRITCPRLSNELMAEVRFELGTDVHPLTPFSFWPNFPDLTGIPAESYEEKENYAENENLDMYRYVNF